MAGYLPLLGIFKHLSDVPNLKNNRLLDVKKREENLKIVSCVRARARACVCACGGIPSFLDKLVKWSEKLQMLFTFGNCKCIHIVHGNMDEEYKMGDAVLGRTTQGT